MKLIVAGSRSITDREMVFSKLDQITEHYLANHPEEIEVVSGGARGVDELGEQWAKARGFRLTVFPAQWAKHGKRAGYLRNEQMAEYATHLVAFWDGQSRGTKHMIDIARRRGLQVRIVRLDITEQERRSA